MRRSALWPPSKVSWARPPTRRSTVALWPNHVPNPSAVVIASHTFAGGWATLMLRSIRSGKAMTHLHLWQPDGCVKSASGLMETVGFCRESPGPPVVPARPRCH